MKRTTVQSKYAGFPGALPSTPMKRTKAQSRYSSRATPRLPMAFAKRVGNVNKASQATTLGSPGVLKQLTQLTGMPLPRELLAAAQRLLGTDLSEVMVHTSSIADQAAASIGANAFAIGPNLFFRSGQYAPHTLSGQQLLMHELTHAAQWIRGDIAPGTAPEGFQVAAPSHHFEQEADSIAALVRPGFNWASSSENIVGPATQTAHNELPLGPQTPRMAPAPTLGGFVLRDGDGNICIGAPTEVPEGGTDINRPGRINWADDPKVRLRGSDSTSADNIIGELDYNTRIQVIKEMPGSWYFVSTESGTLGYVYKEYVWTNLPEPNAQLHKVEEGDAGTAIAIAERYYGDQANDWGQDLRFYVNVLAWANGVEVPNTTDGWRNVRFQAGENRWIPSAQFARSLVGVVNSGSYSYNTMDAVGLADVVERMGELWDDFAKAITLAGQYIPEALADGFFEGIQSALMALAQMLLISAVIMAVSTAVGAAIGALAGGAGAAPGAAAGFELGMLLLEWMGMAFLIAWIGDALIGVGSAFGGFLAGVWNARGNEATLDAAAQELAQGLGLLLKTLVEAIILFGVGKGLGYAVGKLKSTQLGEAIGETALARWLGERISNRSGRGSEQGEQGGGERGSGEQGSGEHGSGERGSGERGSGERGSGERGSSGEHGSGGRAVHTNRTASELINSSEGRLGNPNARGRQYEGHAGDHIPREGATRVEVEAHAQRRPNKQNTTVYYSRRHAIQDLRIAMNEHAAAIEALPAGESLSFRSSTTHRPGFNSRNGEAAYEVSFNEITIAIERLTDGTLHLIHMSPRISQ